MPTVVDISMLYGFADAPSIWQWPGQSAQQPLPTGQVEGITDADAILAYALGQRLPNPWVQPFPIRPITISLSNRTYVMPEPASPGFDQVVQVPYLDVSGILPYSAPLAVTFTVTGDM